MSISWFVSTIILTALGFICGLIHLLCFFCKNEKYFVKCSNYAIVFFSFTFRIFAGFVAILQVPGLKGADVDLSLFRLALQTLILGLLELLVVREY